MTLGIVRLYSFGISHSSDTTRRRVRSALRLGAVGRYRCRGPTDTTGRLKANSGFFNFKNGFCRFFWLRSPGQELSNFMRKTVRLAREGLYFDNLEERLRELEEQSNAV
jgi:hypothetical protein